MKRYDGTAEPLCSLDVSDVVSWIAAIPLEEWPQRDRMRADYQYPAMVSNPVWHDFKAKTDGIVAHILGLFPGCWPDHRMLSVVIPGQRVAVHTDVQSESWRVRIHVPLITNPQAIFTIAGADQHLEVGTAYLVNPEIEHSVANLGEIPRIHFFFDLREGKSA